MIKSSFPFYLLLGFSSLAYPLFGKGMFLFDETRIVEVRAHRGEEPYTARVAELLRQADAIVESGVLYSVTSNAHLPASGDAHDYFSTGPYWWPNPATEDGLPYVRRDGEINPERDLVSDTAALKNLCRDVQVLAVGFGLTGEERYVDQAMKLLQTWFVDPATRMNPNMRYAQAKPGIVDGRGIGIIDSHEFVYLADVLWLLRQSPHWRNDLDQALRGWFGDYLDWLLVHPQGRAEEAYFNNHGVAYDVQIVGLALNLGRVQLAKTVLETATRRRIDAQIEPDGSMPHELSRTTSWNYTAFNLRHFYNLALLGRAVGLDLFSYPGDDGGGLQAALDFSLPFALDPESWPYEQIIPFEPEKILRELCIARAMYGDSRYADAVAHLHGESLPLLEYLTVPVIARR